MSYKAGPKNKTLRTPMQGTVAGSGKTPKIAENTNIPGSAPKAAKVSSPLAPKNPGRQN